MQKSHLWVDNEAHLLHLSGRVFPCDRDVEALLPWQNQALLLSSDTDCLSLWDAEGLVRLARVGVYPQDMAIWECQAVVCGGADGLLHLLDLPELRHSRSLTLPGMPERIAIKDGTAHILTLLTEPEVHTALLCVPLPTGPAQTVLTLPGIPGAIAADATGVWAGVSEKAMHIPDGAYAPDVVIDGFELPGSICVHQTGVIVTDSLTERTVWIRC